MSRSTEWERLLPMKKLTQQLIAEVRRSSSRDGMTIGIDLGDVWSHYCTLNEDGEVVGRGRFVLVHRESRSGLPICLRCGSRWKRARTRSGSASSFRNWVTK